MAERWLLSMERGANGTFLTLVCPLCGGKRDPMNCPVCKGWEHVRVEVVGPTDETGELKE